MGWFPSLFLVSRSINVSIDSLILSVTAMRFFCSCKSIHAGYFSYLHSNKADLLHNNVSLYPHDLHEHGDANTSTGVENYSRKTPKKHFGNKISPTKTT